MMKRYTFLLIVLLLALMALAGGAAAEPTATSTSFIPGEPNDTFADAIPFDPNEYYKIGYFLSAADLDYYRIDVMAPTQLSTEVETGYTYDQTGMTAEIAVYDAAHTLLAENADCNDPARIEMSVPAGAFYIRVRPCPGTLDIDETYRLEAYWEFEPTEVEPNNTRPTASTLNTAKSPWHDNAVTRGAINSAGDVDFYRFEGQAGRWISIYTYDAVGLSLQMSTGEELVAGQSMEFKLPAAGTYYLRARSATHPTGAGEYAIYFSADGHMVRDVEPNDTPAQATQVVYGDIITGKITATDVADYYRFDGQAGDAIALANDDMYDYGNDRIALYDPDMNPVAINLVVTAYEGLLPTTGSYTLVFTAPESTEYYPESYGWNLLLLTGGEPNNTMATATEIPFGPTLVERHDYPCDVDWYHFRGRAGDVFRFINKLTTSEDIYLFTANGTHLTGHVLPADGVYYLRVDGIGGDDKDAWCNEESSTVSFAEALWVSAAANGLGGNATIKQGDIVTRKDAPGQWQIVFDASDVGITRNVVAFERLPNGSILMSLAAAQNVPGLGKVMPQDVIRFVPTSLGDNTAGTFAWYLDGSDVGLTTAGEKIDAIAMQPDYDNPLRISTTGAGSVPRQSGGVLKFADEDMINFVATSYGANSAGKWRMNIDGSTTPGMAAEDITAATRVEVYPARDSDTLLSFDSTFTIGGTAGTFRDVLYEGTWRPAVQKLTDKKIDGLSVGAAWRP